MREVGTIERERALARGRLRSSIKLFVRTLTPITAVNVFIVFWLSGWNPWILVPFAAFLANNVIHVSWRTRHLEGDALFPGALVIYINLLLFAAIGLIAGPTAPGWILFVPPLFPATVLLERQRLLATAVTNLLCLGVNLATEQPLLVTVGSGVGIAAFSIILLRLTSFLRLQTEELDNERQRSDQLLSVVLPPSIVTRLKGGETHIAERFDSATLLFADLVGFTPMAEKMPPEELVALLDRVFTSFDRLVDEHGLEKIKTIGDAYMIASGLNGGEHDPRAVARFGLAMIEAVSSLPATDPKLQVRVGIHSGPVVAGIVGLHRFVYDVWGDTVNTAARMEAHGEPGRVQVSEATHASLVGAFELEPRGTIEIKGKEPMRTWLVSRENDGIADASHPDAGFDPKTSN